MNVKVLQNIKNLDKGVNYTGKDIFLSCGINLDERVDLWNRSNVPRLGKKWQWEKFDHSVVVLTPYFFNGFSDLAKGFKVIHIRN